MEDIFTGMDPKFSDIYSSFETEMVQDAYDTIKQLGLWEWFGTYEPHPNEGFMFTTDMNVATIGNALKYTSHSGSSFGWTMRVVHDIAKNGWESHKMRVLDKRNPPTACPCRRANGERHGWCGVAGGGVPACEH